MGLVALVARYEPEIGEDREPLFKIIDTVFPQLGLLVNNMFQHRENADALHMLHMVCKVFYKANHLILAPSLMQGDVIDNWL